MIRTSRLFIIIFGLIFLFVAMINVSFVSRAINSLSFDSNKNTALNNNRWLVVAIVPDGVDSFYKGLSEGILQEAPGHDASVLFLKFAQSDKEEAMRMFNTAVAARIDGIIMYSFGDVDIDLLAKEAFAEGVAFMALGRDAPPKTNNVFIGTGSKKLGLEAGRLIGNNLGNTARAGIILPTEGNHNIGDSLLFEGLKEGLMVWKGAEIVSVVRPVNNSLSGEQAASELLRDHPETNAIFCASSIDTLGAAQLIVDMNKVGKILIVGMDETENIRRYIERAVVYASIVRDSRWMGREAMRSVIDLIQNQTINVETEAGYYILKKE